MVAHMSVIFEVVSQFAENCAALWEQRERAAKALLHSATLDDLTHLDDRIDACLDGLRVSEPHGRRVATEALQLHGNGEIFTAAVLAFEQKPNGGKEGDPIQAVFDSIETPSQAIRPLSVALDWISTEQFTSACDRIAALELPLARAAFLIASARRSLDCGKSIKAALRDSDPVLVRAGCQAAMWSGFQDAVELMEGQTLSDDLENCETAAHCALLLGSGAARVVLKRLTADQSSPSAETSAVSLFRCLPPGEALATHAELFGRHASRPSVRASGSAGIPELIPHLLECLEYPPLARLAGEAISEITGADLKRGGLTLEIPPPGGGPTEDPEDETIDPDPDDGLPWPDRSAVTRWWSAQRANFVPMTRYLAGTPVATDSLPGLLASGLQRRRAAAAALLAISGKPLFDVCAPAFRQAQRLTSETAWR
jgi:uncharacterized protein (TIGR02270 family)